MRLRPRTTTSRLRLGVNAADVIDLDYQPWHTPQDTMDKLSAHSFQVVGDVMVAVLKDLEELRQVESTLDGALIVDKPSDWTSHDVVNKARRILGTKRIGHLGTLDPIAQGCCRW